MSDFYGHHIGVAAVCWDGESDILLQHRNKDPGRGYLVLPGGTLEKEDSRAGMQRELKEEIDVEATSLMHLTFNSDTTSQDHPITMLYFLARVDRQRVRNVEPDKCLELVWVNVHNTSVFGLGPMWEGDRLAFVEAQSYIRRKLLL